MKINFYKNSFLAICFVSLLASCSQDETIINEGISSNTKPEIATTTGLPKKKVSLTKFEKQIIALINKHRKSKKLPAVKFDKTVQKYAKKHNQYMIKKGRISHDKFNDRFNALRKEIKITNIGENVAMGYSSAKAVFNGWINSPGHKENIEGRDFTHFGLSAMKNKKGSWYYTNIFVRK